MHHSSVNHYRKCRGATYSLRNNHQQKGSAGIQRQYRLSIAGLHLNWDFHTSRNYKDYPEAAVPPFARIRTFESFDNPTHFWPMWGKEATQAELKKLQ